MNDSFEINHESSKFSKINHRRIDQEYETTICGGFSNLSIKLQSKIGYRFDQTLLERSWSVLAGKGGQEKHATGCGRDPG